MARLTDLPAEVLDSIFAIVCARSEFWLRVATMARSLLDPALRRAFRYVEISCEQAAKCLLRRVEELPAARADRCIGHLDIYLVSAYGTSQGLEVSTLLELFDVATQLEGLTIEASPAQYFELYNDLRLSTATRCLRSLVFRGTYASMLERSQLETVVLAMMRSSWKVLERVEVQLNGLGGSSQPQSDGVLSQLEAMRSLRRVSIDGTSDSFDDIVLNALRQSFTLISVDHELIDLTEHPCAELVTTLCIGDSREKAYNPEEEPCFYGLQSLVNLRSLQVLGSSYVELEFLPLSTRRLFIPWRQELLEELVDHIERCWADGIALESVTVEWSHVHIADEDLEEALAATRALKQCCDDHDIRYRGPSARTLRHSDR